MPDSRQVVGVDSFPLASDSDKLKYVIWAGASMGGQPIESMAGNELCADPSHQQKGRDVYFLTLEEMDMFTRRYPTWDWANPQWQLVERDLVQGGHDVSTLRQVNVMVLLNWLRELGDFPRGQPTAPATPAPQGPADHQAEWLAKAMLLVRDHPDWADAEIARRVGKNPGTLSRSNEYQMAAKLARGSRTDRLKGHVTVDPDSGAADVEAVAPAGPAVDDHSDRGQPIPGSRFFREYCAECDEPMKVTKDKVGTKPLCQHCAE